MKEYLIEAAEYAAKQSSKIEMFVRVEGIELVRAGFYHRIVIWDLIEHAKANPLIDAIDQLMAMGLIYRTTVKE